MATPDITTIGIIGAGHIGAQLARLGVQHGYRVVLSNSRGPETLTELVGEIGGDVRAATAEEAAAAGDVVVVTIPLKNIGAVPVAPLDGKIVIDTNNYYPQRDGHIAALDEGRATSAGLLQRHLPGSRVVKAFNHIRSTELTEHATASGTPGRRALAVYGDDAGARAVVEALIDEFGFDTVDGGTLEDSRRIEPGTPGYGAVVDAEGLRSALEGAAA